MNKQRSIRLGGLAVIILLCLGIGGAGCSGHLPAPDPVGPSAQSIPLPASTSPEITAADLAAHVRALTDPRTEGRATGRAGEALAADYLERFFARLDLSPVEPGGSMRHGFDFTAGLDLGRGNRLEWIAGRARRTFEIGTEWRPLAFSRSGEIAPAEVVFLGYGLKAPASGDDPAIDDYRGVDVSGRWVLVLRDLPSTLDAEDRQSYRRYASLRYKAMVARDAGAAGILFASGPKARFRSELVPLRFDASLAGTRIAVASVSVTLADDMLASTGRDLAETEIATDRRFAANDRVEKPADGVVLEGFELGGRIELDTIRAQGTNVVARLQVGDEPSAQTIVLGAHFDHLGRGEGSSSLATADEAGTIHPGADDNASGTALLLELAEALAAGKRSGLDLGTRDFVFAAWSGEELGLLGSNAWVGDRVDPHGTRPGPIAYLNFDMVGRLRESLVLQGFGSSPDWAAIVDRAARDLDLPIVRQDDSYVPTDATSFYTQGVPVLSAFTGVHSEYHTPRDTLDRLDLEATMRIGTLFLGIAESLAQAESPPTYRAQAEPSGARSRGGFRVFLGTIPDYAQTDVVGVRLSGVAPEGPAENAGLRGGDVIVTVDGRSIENLYDYTYALEALRAGEPTRIEILRAGRRIELDVVPTSRD